MKEKKFNYNTIYINEKEIADTLLLDFNNSKMTNKSEYLKSLILLGLELKGNQANTSKENIILNCLENKLDKLQNIIIKEQAENVIYKKLLCNIYYIVETMFDDSLTNSDNYLPARLLKELDEVMKSYANT